MSTEAIEARPREWEHSPEPDGEPILRRDGTEILGWHPRAKGQDPEKLLAEFTAFEQEGLTKPVTLQMRPILVRFPSDVECRINGWEEGAFVPCTDRAKNPEPMWQIERVA